MDVVSVSCFDADHVHVCVLVASRDGDMECEAETLRDTVGDCDALPHPVSDAIESEPVAEVVPD